MLSCLFLLVRGSACTVWKCILNFTVIWTWSQSISFTTQTTKTKAGTTWILKRGGWSGEGLCLFKKGMDFRQLIETAPLLVPRWSHPPSRLDQPRKHWSLYGLRLQAGLLSHLLTRIFISLLNNSLGEKSPSLNHTILGHEWAASDDK